MRENDGVEVGRNAWVVRGCESMEVVRVEGVAGG